MSKRKRKYPVVKNHRSQSNGAKITNITFRLPIEAKRNYKLLCTVRGIGMSTALRDFVTHSIEGS